jgi:hypothetical protein
MLELRDTTQKDPVNSGPPEDSYLNRLKQAKLVIDGLIRLTRYSGFDGADWFAPLKVDCWMLELRDTVSIGWARNLRPKYTQKDPVNSGPPEDSYLNRLKQAKLVIDGLIRFDGADWFAPLKVDCWMLELRDTVSIGWARNLRGALGSVKARNTLKRTL